MKLKELDTINMNINELAIEGGAKYENPWRATLKEYEDHEIIKIEPYLEWTNYQTGNGTLTNNGCMQAKIRVWVAGK